MFRFKLLAPLALALLAGFAQAQTASPPPVLAFFQPAELEETRLSPSGRYLAVTTAKLAGRRALYVFDLHGGAPTQAARIEGLDVVGVRWVNDERLLFQVVNLALGSGSMNHEPPGLFAVNRDGNELREIVRRTYAPSTASKLRDRSLAPNHELLTVPMPVAGSANDSVIVGEARYNTKRELTGMKPFRVNVITGMAQAIEDVNAPPNTAQWFFDSRGNPRLAVAVEDLNFSYYVRPEGEKEWKQIASAHYNDLPFTPQFFGDDGTLYVSHRKGVDGVAVLSRFDFKTGKPAAEALVSTPGFDFSGELLRGDKGEALGLSILTDAVQAVWFDAAMKAFQVKVDGLLPGRVNSISCRRCGKADMVALVRSSSDREPGEVLVYRADKDQFQRVGRVRPAIDPAQMGRMDFQRIKVRDGLEMPVWITYPAGHKPGVKPAKPLPTVLFVHGGPNLRGSTWGWNPYVQFLASRGYLVIEPEFRGSDGFGRRHLEAGYKQWGLAMQDDVADALLWAQKQGLASDKACIAGGSYGGYATLAGLARHPELYRCGMAFVAVSDLMLLAQGSAWVDTDVSPLSRSELLTVRLGDPVKDEGLLRTHSPINNAGKIKAPLLLVMGEADVRVPIAHGNRMRDAMKDAGKPVDYVVYRDEGHSFLKTETLTDFASRMEAFLAKHLDKP